MSFHAGKGTRIFAAEYDVSGEGRQIDLTVAEVDTVDSSTFTTANAKGTVQGQYGASVAHKGVFTKDATNWDYWLHNTVGSFVDKGLTVVPGSYTVGATAYNGEIIEATANRTAQTTDLVSIDASYKCKGPLGRGKLIEYEQDAAVGAQNGAEVDMGRATAATEAWLITMHCTEINDGSSYYIKLQESSDSGGSPDTYADVASGVLCVATVATSLCTVLAGARERYIRVVTTQEAGTPTAKFAVAVSIIPKP